MADAPHHSTPPCIAEVVSPRETGGKRGQERVKKSKSRFCGLLKIFTVSEIVAPIAPCCVFSSDEEQRCRASQFFYTFQTGRFLNILAGGRPVAKPLQLILTLGAAPLALRLRVLTFSSAVYVLFPQTSSHCLSKLQNSRQPLLTPQLPRVSFE